MQSGVKDVLENAHGACGAKLGVSTNYPLAQEVVEREYDCVPPPTSQTDCLAANEGSVWVVVDASISNRDGHSVCSWWRFPR